MGAANTWRSRRFVAPEVIDAQRQHASELDRFDAHHRSPPPGAGCCGTGSRASSRDCAGGGIFFKGLAWYDVHSTASLATDPQTMVEWNRLLHDDYEKQVRDYYARLKGRNLAPTARESDYLQRLSENAAPDDIKSGAALNLMLAELSIPAVNLSTWQLAKLDLPPAKMITTIPFRFVGAIGAKDSRLIKGSLKGALISLNRLSMEGNWPFELKMAELETERPGL